VRSSEPALEAQLQLSEAKVEELEATYSAEFVEDRAKASVIREQLDSETAARDRIRERAQGLIARANTDGVFISPEADNMPGRYFRKGELLGYVIEKGHPLARVMVSQDAVDMVRLDTDQVTVRHVHRPDVVSEGRIVRRTSAGVEYLPSRALSTEGGGLITTDPRDQKGVKMMQRMFQFDIQLENDDDVAFFGERVYVRFNHEKEPLALQWYRGIRLLFLSRFNV